MFDRTIKTRLLSYLGEHLILPKHQYVFRKGLGI